MKKLIALILVFIMSLSNMSLVMGAEEDYYEITDEDLMQAEYEIDKNGIITGMKILENRDLILEIPDEIDGIPVKGIKRGVLDNIPAVDITLPQSIESIDEVIITNCHDLYGICTDYATVVTCKIYENCPNVTEDVIYYMENLQTYNRQNLPQDFLKKIGVFTGDNRGNMNWKNSLTRAEAAVLIIRLLGKEQEAKGMENEPSEFTDIPDWAKGYVNFAFKNNIVKGVGEGRFNPDGICSAQDFCLMLLRLTDLEENKDFSWQTSIKDAQSFAIEGIEKESIGTEIFNSLHNNKVFRREYACSLIYRMLFAKADKEGASLADLLIERSGFNAVEALRYSVRVTNRNLKKDGALSLYLTDPKEPVKITFKDNVLKIDDPKNTEISISVAPIDGGGWEIAEKGNSLKITEPCKISLSFTTYPEKGVSSTSNYASFSVRKDKNGVLQFGIFNDGPTINAYFGTLFFSKYGDEIKQKAYEKNKDKQISDEIKKLAMDITKGINNDYDKAKAISKWVSENIAYDVATGEDIAKNRFSEESNGKYSALQSADTVLKNKYGVCSGYSELTVALMTAVGIPCVKISSISANHAWNECYADGRWIVMDNTWDSPLKYKDGKITKEEKFPRYYFDMPRDAFYNSHTIAIESSIFNMYLGNELSVR